MMKKFIKRGIFTPVAALYAAVVSGGGAVAQFYYYGRAPAGSGPSGR